MRFTSKVLKDTLHEKFPDATEDELLKVSFYHSYTTVNCYTVLLELCSTVLCSTVLCSTVLLALLSW